MATITIEDVPASIQRKIGNKTSFTNILWIYWDWMDWCQFDEVIPDNDDILASKNYKKELSKKDWKNFLKNLISN